MRVVLNLFLPSMLELSNSRKLHSAAILHLGSNSKPDEVYRVNLDFGSSRRVIGFFVLQHCFKIFSQIRRR